MISYPVRIYGDHYCGSNLKKLRKAAEINEAAQDLERIINKLLLQQTMPMQSYTYYKIAELSKYPIKLVSKLCFSLDGGHNGFTALRKDLAEKIANGEELDFASL